MNANRPVAVLESSGRYPPYHGRCEICRQTVLVAAFGRAAHSASLRPCVPAHSAHDYGSHQHIPAPRIARRCRSLRHVGQMRLFRQPCDSPDAENRGWPDVAGHDAGCSGHESAVRAAGINRAPQQTRRGRPAGLTPDHLKPVHVPWTSAPRHRALGSRAMRCDQASTLRSASRTRATVGRGPDCMYRRVSAALGCFRRRTRQQWSVTR